MIKNIPENQIPKQVNQGDKFGDLYGSFNIDLTERVGAFRGTRTKLVQSFTSTEANNNVIPFAFAFWNDKFWAAVGENDGSSVLYEGGDNPNDAFTADTRTSSPTQDESNSDLRVFNNRLYAIGSGSIKRISAVGDASWTTVTTSPSLATSGVSHHSTVFQDRLYFIDIQSSIAMIRSMDTAETVTGASGSYTISTGLASEEQNITWVTSGQNKVWFGTTSTVHNHSYIYEWDGQSENVYDNRYKIDSPGTLAGVILDDVPYAVDVNGRLLGFNGSSFVPVDRLPLDNDILTRGIALSLTGKWLHPNGIVAYDGKINFLISNLKSKASEDTNENLPAGVWEYTPETGLYHKYSLSYSPSGATTYTDYGQPIIRRVGALYYSNLNNFTTPDATRNGTLLMGALYYESATTIEGGIFVNDTLDTTLRYSYIITPKIFSEVVQNTWENIILSMDDVSQVRVQYRTSESARTQATITWASTTTFTTTTDVSGFEGYTVDISRGVGGGLTTKVVSVTENAGTYTVTIEDAVTGATGTAYAYFSFWKSIDDVATEGNFKYFSSGIQSTWIQYKIVFQGTTPVINNIKVVSNPHTKLQ